VEAQITLRLLVMAAREVFEKINKEKGVSFLVATLSYEHKPSGCMSNKCTPNMAIAIPSSSKLNGYTINHLSKPDAQFKTPPTKSQGINSPSQLEQSPPKTLPSTVPFKYTTHFHRYPIKENERLDTFLSLLG
jgi:hypothetical protein